MKFQRITVDARQMGGVPCNRGIRIPVATVVAMVADQMSEAEILEAYPDLESPDIREALHFAAEAIGASEVQSGCEAVSTESTVTTVGSKISVEFDSSFRPELRSDYAAVGRSVVDVVGTLIPGSPPWGERTILCSQDTNSRAVPYVEWPSPSPECYSIKLANIGARDYCRLAFQLSHELAHVLMDPSRNNGAIEMIAVALSWQSLDLLSETWEVSPPHATWKSFARHFREYRKRAAAEAFAELPGPIRAAVVRADWEEAARFVRERRGELESNPYNRPLNCLGAWCLLQAGVPWCEVPGIARKTRIGECPDGAFHGNAHLNPGDIPDWLTLVWSRD